MQLAELPLCNLFYNFISLIIQCSAIEFSASASTMKVKLFYFCALVFALVTNGESCKPRSTTLTSKKILSGSIDIDVKNTKVTLNIRKNDGTSMDNVLLTSIPKLSNENTVKIEDCGDFTSCISINKVVHTKVRADPDNSVIQISRVVSDPDGKITDCYQLDDQTQWFGGPQMRYQHWPIQNMYYEEEPYVPTHPTNMALAERYWLSGNGLYIYVNEEAPLFLDQNNYKEKHLCLIAKNKSPYRKRESIVMNYEIGVFANPRLAHEYVVKTHFGKPTGHPDERMIVHPIWSTWARYKADIDEKKITSFADDIIKNGFNNSQLEIDDNWETCYGSANFDSKKFPKIKELLASLKAKKFRVTLWIHPFINENCNDGEGYDFAKKNNYFVKNMNGEVHTTWWQGVNGAGAIDFTNPQAVSWWVSRLKKLEALGIDSFKFDAGEESFVPQTPALTGPTNLQPGIYTLNYTSNLAKHFNSIIEARVGWRTQKLPIFIRMIDKDTRWTWNNGLPTLVTTLLQMNLNGYVFVLPDMIGGNGYVNNSLVGTELPPKELFIRWLQANVFMPSLQYSFVPWDFDAETVKISKTFTDLHAKIAPKIVELMKKSVQTGAPLNPPIWWVDPTDAQAHKINDEYLLGEEILVAPVIEENSVSRDIYLPKGQWKDANTNKVYTGRVWLKDYPAPLSTLPYFYKV